MNYTIKELAKLAGVSVRTLHYYDQIGLLRPSRKATNGYRVYQQAELLRLQQILFYRELEFSLEEIKAILDNPRFNIVEALKEHKKMLQVKRRRLDGLLLSISNTLNSMEKNQIDPDELYSPFNDDHVKEYQQEVKERWGNTDAYRQSMQKVGRMSRRETEELKVNGEKLTQKIADKAECGYDHREVQDLIEEHYQSINFFYSCTPEMYRAVGQMYVDDSRFAAYYEKFKPGLALFMRDAIAYYCDQKKK